MLPFKKALMSSIGKKYLMAMSGLALVGFLVSHLLANMLLYLPDGSAYNTYAHKLMSYAPGIWVVELGLAGLFVFHAALAIGLHSRKGDARKHAYVSAQTSKGGSSRFGLSANNMIYSGGVLLAFLIAHVIHFRFGPGIAEGYTTMLHGEEARDLHRFVGEELSNPPIAALYMGVMVFLGLHIRHGFWSALQSLGAMAPRYDKLIYGLGLLVAAAFAGGFLGIPIWYLLDVPGMLK